MLHTSSTSVKTQYGIFHEGYALMTSFQNSSIIIILIHDSGETILSNVDNIEINVSLSFSLTAE